MICRQSWPSGWAGRLREPTITGLDLTEDAILAAIASVPRMPSDATLGTTAPVDPTAGVVGHDPLQPEAPMAVAVAES